MLYADKAIALGSVDLGVKAGALPVLCAACSVGDRRLTLVAMFCPALCPAGPLQQGAYRSGQEA